MEICSEPRMKIGQLQLLQILLWINALWDPIDAYGDNTELIQQRAGTDVSLNCAIKGLLNDDTISSTGVHWYFKACGEKSYQISCKTPGNWVHLTCTQSPCKSQLHLEKITEKHSGLYKCTIYPYRLDHVTTLDIQLVRTYQLDVKDSMISVPEFLDAFPENKTVSVGSQVVFQCRVQSQVHPTIKWFRRIPDTSTGVDYVLGQENFNSHIVQYNGATYELLEAAREKNLDDKVYLSKLILNGVRIQDEGFYACVAISYRGHRIREAYLEVQSVSEEVNDVEDESNDWEDYNTSDEQTDPREFWLLFLMPLGLAVLPITFWLCYVIHKRCTVVRKEIVDEERSLQ